MEKIYIKDIKSGKKVLLQGWVHDTRQLGKVRFLLLRDITGIIQVVAHADQCNKKTFDLMMSVPRESAIQIIGKTKADKKAPGGVEVVPDEIEILGKAEHPIPIDVSNFSKTELSKRLDYRFLDFHRIKTQAVFKIQSEIVNSFRTYFYENGFLEMQPPEIISSASEGGTELFPVRYFEKEAYLAQSPQLYKQMVACSMGKTFTVCPVWRAEKHNTTRHINEIRQMDIEMPFANQFDVMKEQEKVIRFIVERVIKNCKKELEILGTKLKIPDAKYLSYDETLSILSKNKVEIPYGEDLTPEAERKLSEIYPEKLVFVHSWPSSIKPFYIMPKEGKANSKLSEGFDTIYKGLEISSGGQRIHIPELLIERIRAKGLNPKNFKYYIDSFRYGAPPHGGWSIGLERFTQVICGLDNIKEATMFPRDRDRLTP